MGIVGQTIGMSCLFRNPAWFKDDEIIPFDVVLLGNLLVIPNVTMDHHGEYICQNEVTGEQGYSSLFVACKK